MDKIILRKWTINDVKNLEKFANNPKIAKNVRNIFPHPYTQQDAINFIGQSLNTNPNKFLFLAIDQGGEAIGSITLSFLSDVYSKSAEIGYWLAEPFWNQGIMTEAILKICAKGFSEYEIIRIFAEVYSYNNASQKALEKAGFNLEGVLKKSIYKYGKIYDAYLYALVKN